MNYTLHECMKNLYPIYMENGIYPFKSPLNFYCLDDAIKYGLVQRPFVKDRPPIIKYEISPRAQIILDNINSIEKSQLFKTAITRAALSSPILHELTIRYFLGLADPIVQPMIRYLTMNQKLSEQEARKMISICISNYRWAASLGVKLSQVLS